MKIIISYPYTNQKSWIGRVENSPQFKRNVGSIQAKQTDKMFIGIDNKPRQLLYPAPEIRENALCGLSAPLWVSPITAQQRYDESKRVPIGKQPLSRRSFPGGAIYPTDKPSSKRKPAKEAFGSDFTYHRV